MKFFNIATFTCLLNKYNIFNDYLIETILNILIILYKLINKIYSKENKF